MAFLKAAGEKAFLHSLQEGFRPSTNILNHFSEQELEYLANKTCEFLFERKGYSSKVPKSIPYSREISDPTQADENKTLQASHVLSVIFRDASRSSCEPEEFRNTLISVSDIHSSLCDVLKRVWAGYYTSSRSFQMIKKVLSIGKLSGFEWKFGVSTESSKCSKLNSPFIILVFRITDTNGMVKSHSVEMTVAEFNQFCDSLNSISAVLDTL